MADTVLLPWQLAREILESIIRPGEYTIISAYGTSSLGIWYSRFSPGGAFGCYCGMNLDDFECIVVITGDHRPGGHVFNLTDPASIDRISSAIRNGLDRVQRSRNPDKQIMRISKIEHESYPNGVWIKEWDDRAISDEIARYRIIRPNGQ